MRKLGDKAKVVSDPRAEDKSFGEFFAKYVGQVGTITYLDQELTSLRFDDGSVIAYWHSEVEDV